MNKKLLDVLVIGTGLSSLCFINSYLEKKKKIHVVSFEGRKNFYKSNFNKDILKFLPPQMLNKSKRVNDYLFYNKFKINKNCNIFGSLEFGGLSNYWGKQIDKNIEEDLKNVKKTTKQKIIICFFEILQMFKLLGKINIKKKI